MYLLNVYVLCSSLFIHNKPVCVEFGVIFSFNWIASFWLTAPIDIEMQMNIRKKMILGVELAWEDMFIG